MWDPDAHFLDFNELESQLNEFLDRSTIEENIRRQLEEFEMIQSMYSNPKEVVLDNPLVIDELKNYADGKGASLPPHLDFYINILIEDQKFEINVNLPLEYPTHEPDIFVRNNSFGRTQQHCLNEDLSRFISLQRRDELCILSGITWLQENAMSYMGKKKVSTASIKPRNILVEAWARMWIYSHHIYSKSKRKELQDLAQEFNLTGFCLPGRPGIICFEGAEEDCEECWLKVKSMNWKKIVCVKKETVEIKSNGANNRNNFRLFEQFRELCFETSSARSNAHMDFGEFYRYLSKHNCEYAFKSFFGLDGKISG